MYTYDLMSVYITLRTSLIFRIFLIFFSWVFVFSVSFGEIQDSIEERQAMFKQSKKSMRALRDAIRNEDLENALKSINFHTSWSDDLVSLFPEGSEASMSNDSDASGAIWLDFEGFQSFNKDYFKESLKVKTALERQNFNEAMGAFFKMAKTCKKCHQSFRN